MATVGGRTLAAAWPISNNVTASELGRYHGAIAALVSCPECIWLSQLLGKNENFGRKIGG